MSTPVNKAKIVKKITKTLNLVTSSSKTEAETSLRQANKLMQKYQITLYDLDFSQIYHAVIIKLMQLHLSLLHSKQEQQQLRNYVLKELATIRHISTHTGKKKKTPPPHSTTKPSSANAQQTQSDPPPYHQSRTTYNSPSHAKKTVHFSKKKAIPKKKSTATQQYKHFSYYEETQHLKYKLYIAKQNILTPSIQLMNEYLKRARHIFEIKLLLLQNLLTLQKHLYWLSKENYLKSIDDNLNLLLTDQKIKMEKIAYLYHQDDQELQQNYPEISAVKCNNQKQLFTLLLDILEKSVYVIKHSLQELHHSSFLIHYNIEHPLHSEQHHTLEQQSALHKLTHFQKKTHQALVSSYQTLYMQLDILKIFLLKEEITKSEHHYQQHLIEYSDLARDTYEYAYPTHEVQYYLQKITELSINHAQQHTLHNIFPHFYEINKEMLSIRQYLKENHHYPYQTCLSWLLTNTPHYTLEEKKLHFDQYSYYTYDTLDEIATDCFFHIKLLWLRKDLYLRTGNEKQLAQWKYNKCKRYVELEYYLFDKQNKIDDLAAHILWNCGDIQNKNIPILNKFKDILKQYSY